MLLGSIFCRDLKNVVVVEGGLKLEVDKGAELVSSYSCFECDINDKF